ncbi:MAG: hypothetical protein QHJ73_17415, partial [Armatimonadota bacterium]|nr:hypothetical protein [Armatimonadota bacterium]
MDAFVSCFARRRAFPTLGEENPPAMAQYRKGRETKMDTAAAPPLGERAQLALDSIWRREERRVPSWMLHIMEHAHLERIAGVQPGEYLRRPEEVYLECQH